MIARNSKGRLATKEETVSIKVKLDKSTAEQLRICAEELGVPMATIIRHGISKVYEEVFKEESK